MNLTLLTALLIAPLAALNLAALPNVPSFGILRTVPATPNLNKRPTRL